MVAITKFFTLVFIFVATSTRAFTSHVVNPTRASVPLLLIISQLYYTVHSQVMAAAGATSSSITIKKPNTTTPISIPITTPTISQKYDDYIVQFKPSEQLQKGSSQYTYRTLVYNQNLNKINVHNKDAKKKYTMGLNRFSDIETNQFISLYSKLIIPSQIKKTPKARFSVTFQSTTKADTKPTQRLLAETEASITTIASAGAAASGSSSVSISTTTVAGLLASVDAGSPVFINITNTPNYTVPPNIIIDWSCKASPIINQGACGSCYAIASLQSIYITMRMYGQSILPMSTQEVISCGQPTSGVYGCGGGYFISSFEYTRVNGTGRAIMYPYSNQSMNQGITPACNYTIVNSSSYRNSKIRIRQAGFIPYADCQTLVNRLKTQALAVSISTAGFQFYVNGTYNAAGEPPNHGVTLVGYDPSRGYKIKNSWGLTWGDAGYAYVSQTTGVCDYAMYPVTGYQDLSITSC